MSERPEGSDDPRVAVYRVVDETERSYLAAHGHYGSNPSQSGSMSPPVIWSGAEA